MQKLVTIQSKAAPVLENAIDTDIIFPARFLLLMNREGLGKHAFSEWRGGDFVLDSPQWKGAQILVVGETFGTGSSREQAVWALADLGIRCVIGRSFGEIFFSNCFKSGVLPIRLTAEQIAPVEDAAKASEEIGVDVEAQEIRLLNGTTIPFEIDAHRKRMLLAGLDDIGLILEDHSDEIAAFEKSRSAWLDIPQEKLDALAGEGR